MKLYLFILGMLALLSIPALVSGQDLNSSSGSSANSYDFQVDAKLFKRIDKRIQGSRIAYELAPSDSFKGKCATAIEVEQSRIANIDLRSDNEQRIEQLELIKLMITAENTQSRQFQNASLKLRTLIEEKDFLNVDKELVVSRISSVDPLSLAMSTCLVAGMEKLQYFSQLVDVAAARKDIQAWRKAFSEWETVNERPEGLYKFVISQNFADIVTTLSIKMKRGLL